MKALQSVLVTEGGLNGARGDQGKSASPLQLFGEEGGRRGQLNAYAEQHGLTLAQARDALDRDPLEAIRFGIGTPDQPGYLASAIVAGQKAGLSGAELAAYAQQHGQVSVSPERAGQNFRTLFGGSGQIIAGPSAPTSDISLSQFGDKTISYEDAAAACGPFAAMRLAATYGNSIPASVALEAAKRVGFTSSGGMNGIANEKRLFDALGLKADLDTSGNWDRIVGAAGQGQMVTISTPGH